MSPKKIKDQVGQPQPTFLPNKNLEYKELFPSTPIGNSLWKGRGSIDGVISCGVGWYGVFDLRLLPCQIQKGER